VKVKKFLSSQEVQEIVSQIKTYSGTPVEPKPAMTAEQVRYLIILLYNCSYE
jgi:predicted ribosome-associated RNA-binding protein Tma20